MHRTYTHYILFTQLLLLFLLVIAFWLRLDNLDTMPPGISTDESFNVVDSFIFAQTGQLPLYEDLNRPEHLHRVILAAGTLFGSSVWAFRVVQVLGGVITVALADWTTRQCLPDLPRPIQRVAGLAAAASLAVAMSHVVLSRSLYRGLWQPVWMLLFIGFLMRGLHIQHIHHRDTENAENIEKNEVTAHNTSRSLSRLETLYTRWRLGGNYRDFILSGVALGLALHTYTAALVIPLALPVVALSLLIFRFKRWRGWLPGLILLGVTLAIITAPITYRLITDRDRVLTRANDVGSELTRDNVEDRFERVWNQITERGDINSQYNADYAPILPPTFDLLFTLGVIALALRLRHPSSALLAILIPLAALPVMMAGEIPHGHRIVGEFAVFPVIIGIGMGSALGMIVWLWERIAGAMSNTQRPHPPQSPLSNHVGRGRKISDREDASPFLHLGWGKRAGGIGATLIALALIALTVHNARDVHAAYRAWWDNNDHPWEIYGRELTHGDWFFRTDHRDLGEWLDAQNDPILVPVSAISSPTMRAWLQPRYAHVTTSETLPTADTLVMVTPWALELSDLWRDERQFALLDGDTITILPPLDAANQAAVYTAQDHTEAVYRANGDLLLEMRPIQPDTLTFETRAQVGTHAAIFEDAVQVTGWRGPDTLDAAGMITYTLDFSATENDIPHYYSAFVQLQTQDFQSLAGDDKQLLRWLYPPPLWQTDDVIPIPFTLYAPPDLTPGAYRLVAGLYRGEYTHLRVPVTQGAGDTPNDMATIGWIKVPQPDSATPDHDALSYDTVLGDQQFALIGGSAEEIEPGSIRLTLTWEVLADRPTLDATIFVHALDAEGNLITQSDARPWNGQYPTFIWDAGEIVYTEHVLATGDTPIEDIHLIAGMYIFVGDGTQRLDVVQNGTAVPDQIIRLGNLADLTAP